MAHFEKVGHFHSPEIIFMAGRGEPDGFHFGKRDVPLARFPANPPPEAAGFWRRMVNNMAGRNSFKP
jgi:hypothetical protein